MKSNQTTPAPVADLDALPPRGGSYIRQPDGSLERVVTVGQQPATKDPIDPVPTSGAKE
jgi:hypothetical protein